MSTIRRQSIISSVITYLGFLIGLVNVYFFTRHGTAGQPGFTEDQYGLTTIFFAIASLMYVLAMLAMPSYIFKFYHYYADHLPLKKNDMLTWSLLVGLIGFGLVVVGGLVFKHLVIRKFGEHSPLLVTYYYWLFPLGFGLTIYSILESYTWSLGKPVVTTLLKEVQWRLLISLLILLFITGIIRDYALFIKLYSFTFAVVALTLFIYLWTKGYIHFTFRPSKVTRRFIKLIVRLCSLVYLATIINIVSQVFDTIVIASVLKDGTAMAGVFSIALLMGSVIQAPQRGIISASISHLSRAWKDKNIPQIQRIYQRSSLNQLIFSLGLFFLIALNYTEAIKTFHLKEIYLLGFTAFLLIGAERIIDMGTGVNAQIITTSNYWKFDMISGIVLLVLMLPLTLFFTRAYGLIGPAIANLISITIYNAIRIIFLWKKFRLFPFTRQTAYAIVFSGALYVICYFACRDVHGWTGLFLRSALFAGGYGAGVVFFRLSSDIMTVWHTILKRLGIRKV